MKGNIRIRKKIVEVDAYSIEGRRDKMELKHDLIAIEKPLNIYVNNVYYTTIFHLPGLECELATGHLFSDGVINEAGDIQACNEASDNTIHFTVPRKVGFLKTSTELDELNNLIFRSTEDVVKISATVIFKAFDTLYASAKIFSRTGSAHAASLSNYNGRAVAFAEDVSRHNAVDKAIGIVILQNSLNAVFLALTGRLSLSIVRKAARAGIQVVASRGATTDAALKLAKQCGITLLGFVRGDKMSIYSHPERIISDK